MRFLSIVGARPQFVKLAAVSRAMAAWSENGAEAIDDIVLHTGQHYDKAMSEIFFEQLEIPRPAVNLNIGSASHAEQTAQMLSGIEKELLRSRPDIVIVYGDTNSTLAGALAASKLGVPIAHVEAGLRSFNRAMPEEINRVVTDHVSDILFAPTETAVGILADENLAERTRNVGDVMLDALLFYRDKMPPRAAVLGAVGIGDERFGVVTLHRAGNTDSKRLVALLDALNRVAEELTLVFPLHPRTLAKLESESTDWAPHANLKVVEPLGYLQFLRLFESASVVLTDSGGLQKEAFFVATPCITLRDETEWPETMKDGANVLVGADTDLIIDAVATALEHDAGWEETTREYAKSAFGHGKAADRIVGETIAWLNEGE